MKEKERGRERGRRGWVSLYVEGLGPGWPLIANLLQIFVSHVLDREDKAVPRAGPGAGWDGRGGAEPTALPLRPPRSWPSLLPSSS